MFGFGNKRARLERKYRQLMEESFKLSLVNRKQSDEKLAEAHSVQQQLENLEQTEQL